MLLHRSAKPILTRDRPWEDEAMLFAVAAFVHPTDGDLVLYYSARRGSWREGNVLCLARSTDGRHWTKPDLGDGTNIVMRGAGHKMDWGEFMPASIIHDADEPDTTRRWKMIYWDRPDPTSPPGICLAVSANGLKWRPLHARPVITNANDAMSFTMARPGLQTPLGEATHFLYQQTWAYNPALPIDRDNLKGMHRRISVWKCEHFADRWVGPVTILEPDAQDAPDLQFYWLTPFPTATGYGAFLNCHHTGDQTMDVQLVTSADGWTWQRAFNRQPVIPLGPRDSFDCGLIIVAAQPLRWRDRVLVFYHGRATVHDHQPRHPADPLPDPSNGIGLAEFTPALLEG
ncbi:MAG: hypothetical protein IT582_05115 [Opitutaceae bacterium]|nr:hypothetical protein [Opitutaceae bacterium]